ncbi:MAG: [FeFe] hydrogenase, group A [Puniceicoccales bacterium]|jgi:NADH-quinone oxidoreductase subunit G|nr:[FeFe] hydrogenase, group A [Puniceicoccales bacterium]
MTAAKINGREVVVPDGSTILDAALSVNIKIPTLCKHKDLFPTAACGLCIVKINGSPRTPRACCTKIESGMDIVTHDPKIVEVRRTVLELILSNHPDSCQHCGRNGCCELQTLAADFGIRTDSIPRYCQDLPVDISTGAIELDASKCIKCGRCVQTCQKMQGVWALSFLHRGINNTMAPAGDISLAESPCVRCGQCAAHCPTGAIVEKDDTPAVWEKLSNGENFCTIQIAPAVRVAIGDAFGFKTGTDCTGKLYTAMRMLGFKAVFDTNFSADLTIIEEAAEFVERFVAGHGQLPLITSCCPAWTDYMEKFYPDFCDNFSTAKSPQQMLGVMAKTYFADTMGIDPSKIVQVSVMPCTAKKYELQRSDEMSASGHRDVDISITTREIARMIKQAGIDFSNLPDGVADSILGEYSGAGTIFGTTGGVMEAALRTAYFNITGQNMPDDAIEIKDVRGLDGVRRASISINGRTISLAVAHGLGNVSKILDEIRDAKRNGGYMPYHFIEVMACRGGCLGGGGQPYGIGDEIRRKRAEGLYSSDRSRPKRCSHDNPEIIAIYKNFLGTPLGEKAHKFLHTSYASRKIYQK